MTEIRKILTYNNMKIKFTDDELAKMNELNITEATIISRLKKVKVLYSSSTEKMSSEEFKEMLLVRQLADENRRCRKPTKLIEIKRKSSI